MYRPLSPHLFIYKPQMSSTLSVFHRVTGSLLSLGLLFLVLFTKVITNLTSFHSIYVLSFYLNTYSAWLIISLFIILIFSFFYHFFNGIRHLIWDSLHYPNLFSKDNMIKSAYLVLFLSFTSGFIVIFLL